MYMCVSPDLTIPSFHAEQVAVHAIQQSILKLFMVYQWTNSSLLSYPKQSQSITQIPP